jgi:hypothetical protein
VDSDGIDGPLYPLENELGRYGSGVASEGVFNRRYACRFLNSRECMILISLAGELQAN